MYEGMDVWRIAQRYSQPGPDASSQTQMLADGSILMKEVKGSLKRSLVLNYANDFNNNNFIN